MRIVVVQTAFLGDLVLTTPLLRELRRVLPAARIEVVTTHAGSGLFAPLSWVDRVHVHRKRPSLPAFSDAIALGRQLRGQRFDAAIAAHRSHRSALIVRMSGAPLRVGFADAPGRWAYTQVVPPARAAHAVDRYLGLSAPLGGSPGRAAREPALHCSARAISTVDELLEQAGVVPDAPILCVAPGSAWATKRWSARGFAEVARASLARGLRPVVIGDPGELPLCRRVARLAGPNVPVLAGRTNVEELVTLLARSVALVGNDSGPAHVAAAVGTPTVAVFGPTVPALGYTPLGSEGRVVEHEGLDCRPCRRHGGRSCPLGHFRCMGEIASERVVAALDELIGADRPQLAGLTRPG